MKTYIIKIKDASIDETIKLIDALIKDEEEAIEAYKSAIERLPQYKEVLTHILEEEIEHKRELEELKK